MSRTLVPKVAETLWEVGLGCLGFRVQGFRLKEFVLSSLKQQVFLSSCDACRLMISKIYCPSACSSLRKHVTEKGHFVDYCPLQGPIFGFLF